MNFNAEYNRKFRELQERHRQEMESLRNGMQQSYMQGMNPAAPSAGGDQAQNPATSGQSVPPHVQNLSALGRLESILTEIRDHLKGTPTADIAAENIPDLTDPALKPEVKTAKKQEK